MADMGAGSPKIEDLRAVMLEEWVRISLPAWRRILKESIQEGNPVRENFARWMLGEVLKDPEYKGIWLAPDKFKVEAEKLEELVDGEVQSLPEEKTDLPGRPVPNVLAGSPGKKVTRR